MTVLAAIGGFLVYILVGSIVSGLLVRWDRQNGGEFDFDGSVLVVVALWPPFLLLAIFFFSFRLAAGKESK